MITYIDEHKGSYGVEPDLPDPSGRPVVLLRGQGPASVGPGLWNTRRLHSTCGDIPPAEFEAAYHQRLQATTEAA